ncbi:hypothetical protein [Pseudomonas sp.]|uniref:hypothetical protein n=1 Tax=Pseudomonas sp. TaxID=306 RepID=UPI0025D7F1B8|nr:hypothetical protein [Pseudomonas sp.]
MNVLICGFLVALAFGVGAVWVCENDSELPEDVKQFVERRDICDHLRGEIGDGNNKNAVDSINKYCSGTDKELSRLRDRYSKESRIISELKGYEEEIEARKP